jgi:hypothetical protein
LPAGGCFGTCGVALGLGVDADELHDGLWWRGAGGARAVRGGRRRHPADHAWRWPSACWGPRGGAGLVPVDDRTVLGVVFPGVSGSAPPAPLCALLGVGGTSRGCGGHGPASLVVCHSSVPVACGKSYDRAQWGGVRPGVRKWTRGRCTGASAVLSTREAGAPSGDRGRACWVGGGGCGLAAVTGWLRGHDWDGGRAGEGPHPRPEVPRCVSLVRRMPGVRQL